MENTLHNLSTGSFKKYMAEDVIILLPMNAETGWNTQNSQTIHMYM